MKLNFPILDEPISVEEGTVLVVEEVTLFSQLVRQFYRYDIQEELKIFDTKFRNLKSQEILVITDILGFDINTPAILKMLYADLINQFNEKPEVKSQIESLANKITDIIGFECLENELDLEYDEIELIELIKALGVKIEVQSDTILDKIYEILQVLKYLTKKKLLVFVNVFSYFTKEERAAIMEYIQLSHLRVLFLEPKRTDGIDQLILDKDFVLMSHFSS